MSTYAQLVEYVKEHHGRVPKTCWIAHVKELNGLPMRRAPNRESSIRTQPCPPDMRKPIEEALQHFGMI